MTETRTPLDAKPLTIAELREALRLVLSDLRDLPYDPLEKVQRLGRLQSYLSTITGERDYEAPIYGLRALRRSRAERERAATQATKADP